MTIANGYCTLADVKADLYAGTATVATDQDSMIERAVEAASRKIDTHCGRRFFLDAAVSTKVYVASNPYELRVDDFSTTTGLVVKTDTAMDATWATTIGASYVQAEPLNGLRDGVSWAYTSVCIVGSGGGYFPVSGAQALVQVTARWGWPDIPAPIRTACIVQTIALLKAPSAPFGTAGIGDMGVLRLKAGLHPTAQELVSDYKRGVLVG